MRRSPSVSICKKTVYGLDTTTIDLCLSVFPWAVFRTAKAAIKLHTLLDLRGNIPTFIHISDGKVHEVNILDQLLPEPGAFYIMDRGFLDFERLYRFTRPAASRDPWQVEPQGPTPLLASVDRKTGLICDQSVVLTGFYSHQGFQAPLRRIRFKDPETAKTLIFLTNNFVLPAFTITNYTAAAGKWSSSSNGSSSICESKLSSEPRKRGQVTKSRSPSPPTPSRHRQEATAALGQLI